MINEYLNNWSLTYINSVILAIVSKQIYTFGRCDDWVTALFIIVHIYESTYLWKMEVNQSIFQIPDFDLLYRFADLKPIVSLRTIIPLFINTYNSNTSTVNFIILPF